MADYASERHDSMSMREKSVLKRRTNKEHNSNFRAGYVNVNEENLHKTGIRGKKRFCFIAIVILMVVLVIVNILTTVLIVVVLRIHYDGITGLEFIPPGLLLRFVDDADLGKLEPVHAVIAGLPENTLHIDATKGNKVELRVRTNEKDFKVNSSVKASANGIELMTKDAFRVVSPDSGQTVFSTESASKSLKPNGVKNLHASVIYTSRVTSGKDKDLSLEGDSVTIRGNEGLNVESADIRVRGANIVLNSAQNLSFEGKDGVRMPQARRFPFPEDSSYPTDLGIRTYKICVCMPAGKLFVVPAPYGCDSANEDVNPCDE